MPTLAYIACAFTSLTCFLLLSRGYAERGTKLLLWSAVCFAGLTLDNIVLVLDTSVFHDIDLSLGRVVPGFVGSMLLVYGLVNDS